MQFTTQHRLRWGIALLIMFFWLALVVVTHLPPRYINVPRLPSAWPIPLDKVFHFCSYAMLTTMLMFQSWAGRRAVWGPLLFWVLILLSYGAVEELTQPMFGRTADLSDWFADLLGVFSGLVFARLVWAIGPRWLSRLDPVPVVLH